MLAWCPVSCKLAERQQKISGDLDYAACSRMHAEALAACRRVPLQHSLPDAVCIVNLPMQNGACQRQSLVAAANTVLALLCKNALPDIALPRMHALASAKKAVADFALAIAQCQLGCELNADDQMH